MGTSTFRAVASVAGALLLFACSVLTGASDLSVCETCDLPEAATGEPELDAGAETSLPPACSAGEVRCDGNRLATCSNGAWALTPCAQACAGGACVPWPSCRASAGDAGCGTGGTISCCESAEVPGGTFSLHNDAAHPATVSTFRLDLFEVTVGRFRAFVEAGMGTQAAPPAAGAGAHPKIPESGWKSEWDQYLPANTAALTSMIDGFGATWTSEPGANETKPIVQVPWLVAFAFCAWDGGRLPTRAEYNYAAVGGAQQRVYPWSSPPTSTTIAPNEQANYDCAFDAPSFTCPATRCSLPPQQSPCTGTIQANCLADGGTCVTPSCFGCEGAADIAPVGHYTKGVGRWGHFELAGNVKELVLDRHPGGNGAPPDGPCVDCALLMPAELDPPMGGKERVVILGGDYNDTGPMPLRGGSWIGLDFDIASPFNGFRCARDVASP